MEFLAFLATIVVASQLEFVGDYENKARYVEEQIYLEDDMVSPEDFGCRWVDDDPSTEIVACEPD